MDLQEQVDQLETQITKDEYEENWNWRHLRDLSPEEAGDLPVPRLELRWSALGEHNSVADYGLVYSFFAQEGVRFAPLGSTRVGGSRLKLKPAYDVPWREGAHIFWDMYHLKLPGFVTGPDGYCRQLSLDDTDALPVSLKSKMEADRDSAVKPG